MTARAFGPFGRKYLASLGGLLFACLWAGPPPAAAQVPLTAVGTPYAQDFNTLASTGTSSVVPPGWAFVESGTNANTTYTAGTGSSNAGDTYSFGASGIAERAFGGLQSGSLIPIVGAAFTNATGGTISSLAVAYTGEQWRLGTLARLDRLDFQYSLDATSLTTGTWVDVDALDFIAPTTGLAIGALDGNAPANRTALASTITGLSIPPGATFWIRWTDFNASGADDGLAVDDFSLTPLAGPATPTVSIADVAVLEGNAGSTPAVFTVQLSAPAGPGGFAFDIATSDGTATAADNDYVPASAAGVTIPEGASSATFTVQVLGDATIEPDETFLVTATAPGGAVLATATGTIVDDDAVVPTGVPLPFFQDWSDPSLITANNDWSGVAGIVGYRGDDLTTAIGADPQGVVADGSATPVNVLANQTNPDTLTTGGIAEFDRLANPVVALQGSGTADAPHLVLSLSTLGYSGIRVRYVVRDVDGSADNAVQPVALQYRVGTTGPFTNVPAAFVADATTGPNEATLATPVDVVLPAAADNRPMVQLRVLTTNAAGSDEWVGIDDLEVAGTPISTTLPLLAVDDVAVAEGDLTPSVATFSVTLSQPAGPGGVRFSIATADGTATASGGDYVPRALADQIIPEGESVFAFDVTVNGDLAIEPDETFSVRVLGVTGAVVAKGVALGRIENDDTSPTPVHVVQGAGARSPLAGLPVTTRGVVFATRANGFFMQAPDGETDGVEETSEGIFVFTGGAPAVAAGDLVHVTGRVVEFSPAADPNQQPLTEISLPAVQVVSTGHPLPAPTALTTADTTVEALEAREAMRVSIPSLTVVGPTLGAIAEPTATAASNGVFYGVVTGVPRPFREAGIHVDDPVPPCAAGAGCAIPRFDGNPERIRVDSDALGGAPLEVTAGAVVTGLVGPLDYAFRTYTLLPEPPPAPQPVATRLGAFRPVPVPGADDLTVASLNLQRFFDDVDDPALGEPVLTPEAFEARLAKASFGIREILRTPDIVGLVEVENRAALEALAARISADAVAGGAPDPAYVGYLEEGNDVGGIDVAFLVRAGRFTSVSVEQVGKDATFVNPDTLGLDLLHDRPPLVLRAETARPTGEPFGLTVIVNHLRSLNGIETARVQAKRRAQAEFLARLVADLQAAEPGARVLLVGDFNAFEVNDGYVDVIGTIAGAPAPPEQVAAASPDLVDPDLTNLHGLLPPGERYSFVFDGSAQTLDHALASAGLRPWVSGFAYGRGNADFPVSLYGDRSRPERLSDHDGAVTYIGLGLPLVTARIVSGGLEPDGPAWVDIEFENRGAANAVDVAVTELTFTALKASPPVRLVDPVRVALLGPGETQVVRVHVSLPPTPKFLVKGRGRYAEPGGGVSALVLKPEMIR